MRHISVLAVSILAACSAAALQSRDIDITIADQRVLVRDETGAIIVGKRHVGRVGEDGRITNNRDAPVAFVYEDSMRLKGGATLPIKADGDGAMYVPEDAQAAAGLTPMRRRVRPDGSVSSTKGAKGVSGKGLGTESARRVLLAIYVLTANDMW